MKYYKIGKVSKLFGVSCETIRNYEKAGLIRSEISPDSSVRHYDIDNVRKLVGIRIMRNQGFSVPELERVYSDMSLEEYEKLTQRKMAEDEHEMQRIELRLAERRRAAEEIARVRSGRMQAELMHYHGGFYLPYQGNDILHTDVNENWLRQWTENLFHVRHMAVYPSLRLSDEPQSEYFNAFHVPLQYVEPLEIDVVPPVKTMRPMRCVSCIVRRDAIQYPFGGRAEEIKEFVRREKLALAGWGFALTLFGYHDKGEKVTYFRLILPLKEAGPLAD